VNAAYCKRASCCLRGMRCATACSLRTASLRFSLINSRALVVTYSLKEVPIAKHLSIEVMSIVRTWVCIQDAYRMR
jgi:hypothetical protein